MLIKGGKCNWHEESVCVFPYIRPWIENDLKFESQILKTILTLKKLNKKRMDQPTLLPA